MKSDDNAIPDPSDKQIDLQSNLVLEVGKSTFADNAVSESGMTGTTITSSSASNANLGQSSIEYGTASTANIGDYMQLQLKDTSVTANEIFSTYS